MTLNKCGIQALSDYFLISTLIYLHPRLAVVPPPKKKKKNPQIIAKLWLLLKPLCCHADFLKNESRHDDNFVITAPVAILWYVIVRLLLGYWTARVLSWGLVIMWQSSSSYCCFRCWWHNTPLIAKFMGPTWGPSGADRTQVGPMLAPWSLLSGSWSPWTFFFRYPCDAASANM